MKQYFVDFENVHEDGLVGVDCVSEPIVVHIINSQMGLKSYIDSLYAGSSLCVYWTFEMALNGQRDALDIQLAAYLGFAVAKSPTDSFYIVSKDKGYDSLIASFAKKGFDISRIANIRGDNELSVQQQESKPDLQDTSDPMEDLAINAQLRCMIPNEVCDNETITRIAAIIEDSNKLQDIYRRLCSIGGVKKGQQIYRYIKPYVQSVTKCQASDIPQKTAPVSLETLPTAPQLRKLLSEKECSDKQLKAIVNIINVATDLGTISREINKLYNDNKKGSSVYKKIKPHIKDQFKK